MLDAVERYAALRRRSGCRERFAGRRRNRPVLQRRHLAHQAGDVLAARLQCAFGHRALELLALKLRAELLELHLVGIARGLELPLQELHQIGLLLIFSCDALYALSRALTALASIRVCSLSAV